MSRRFEMPLLEIVQRDQHEIGIALEATQDGFAAIVVVRQAVFEFGEFASRAIESLPSRRLDKLCCGAWGELGYFHANLLRNW
jgi:hypothetical protein